MNCSAAFSKYKFVHVRVSSWLKRILLNRLKALFKIIENIVDMFDAN